MKMLLSAENSSSCVLKDMKIAVWVTIYKLGLLTVREIYAIPTEELSCAAKLVGTDVLQVIVIVAVNRFVLESHQHEALLLAYLKDIFSESMGANQLKLMLARALVASERVNEQMIA